MSKKLRNDIEIESSRRRHEGYGGPRETESRIQNIDSPTGQPFDRSE